MRRDVLLLSGLGFALLLGGCASPPAGTVRAPDLGGHFLVAESASGAGLTASTMEALRDRGWTAVPRLEATRRFESSAEHDAIDWLCASELRLLLGGRENYFLGARDAWRWLQATRGGQGQPEELQRRALRLYNHNLAGYAAAADWTRTTDHVEEQPVTLARRGLARQHFSRLVPSLGATGLDERAAGGPVHAEYPSGESRDRKWPYLPWRVYCAPFSAVLDFQGGRATVTLHDPAEGETVALFGGPRPLHFDEAGAWSAMTGREDAPDVRPGFTLLAPPDPGRELVLFVHGLDSDPRVVRDLVAALRADAGIRARYRFAAYRYAPAEPLLANAAMLRARLAEFHAWLDAAAPGARGRGTVVIGHGMGGLLAKPLTQTSGQRVWDRVFRQPPHRIAIDSPEAKSLHAALLFEPRPEVRRLVFLGVPHAGTDRADAIRRAQARAIGSDRELDRFRAAILDGHRRDLRPATLERWSGRSTAALSLAPDDLELRLLQPLPLAVPFHTVLGEADDVVPAESARLDGAASEKTVPGGHDLPASPGARDEIRRILLLPAR